MTPLLQLTAAEVAAAESRIPPPKRRRPPITAGRIAYLLLHWPRQLLRDGPHWHWYLWKGRRQLQQAVNSLPAPETPKGEPLAIPYLTGKRNFPPTTIALLSAQSNIGRPVRPMLYHDGRLDAATVAAFKRLFPDAMTLVGQL